MRVRHPETVVVLGAWRQSLTVIRSLGRAGYRVLVARHPGGEYLLASRFASGALDLPMDAQDPRRFTSALEALGPQPGAPILLLPIGDAEIAYVVERESLLPPHVTPVAASREALRICASKELLLGAAERVGVPCVRTLVVDTPVALIDGARSIGFPCLVKRDGAISDVLGEKALILASEEEVLRRFASRSTLSGRVLIQPHFTGVRINVYFFALAGRCVADCFVEVLRTDRLDGTGLAVEGVSIAPIPPLAEHTQRLVGALGYDGAGCAQFLVDPASGTVTFLEVNARLGANFAVVYGSGLDLPLLMIERALGRDSRARLTAPVRIGVRYAWLGGDLEGLRRLLMHGRRATAHALGWLARLVRSQLRADAHVTFDWRDPAPTARLWLDRVTPGRTRPQL